MRGRWAVTWGLCGGSVLVMAVLYGGREDESAATAVSIVATGISLFGVLSAWAWRRSAHQGRSTTGQLGEAQEALARLVGRQWREEAGRRQLRGSRTLPVSWSDSPRAGLRDHAELIRGSVSCRADRTDELAAAFRRLPRRRLVALGDAGSGKSTFAVLLALALLDTREAGEPVPVLLTAASFDPARETVHDWLRRRITADYPDLEDARTYGPSAVDDLLTEHLVLPVVDGLDELPRQVHATVLRALGEILDTDAPLILTCRTDAYTAAVARTGALPGAAVVEPGDLSARDSLDALRLATPAGSAQQRWDSLAEQLEDSPRGAVAEALTSPLIVALARTVYAEGTGDPAELRTFDSKEAIEDHLLDRLVPTVYETARRRAPAGRPWSPEHAHRYLTQLASGMQSRGTHDLAWWQMHRWVPAVSRTWARCAAWAVITFLLALPGYAVGRAFPEYAVGLGHEWIPGSVAVALPGMCGLAAWITTRPGLGAHRLTVAVQTALCGALAYAVPGMTHTPAHLLPEAYAIACLFSWGFAFLLVLYSAGLPAPPPLPSRGTLTPRNRPGHLLLTVAGFLGTTALAAIAFRLYASVIQVSGTPVPSAVPVQLPWTQGLMLGGLFGTLQALLYWTRGTTCTQEVTRPVSTIRADRLVTLVSGGAGLLLVTLPYDLCSVLLLSLPGSAGQGPQGNPYVTAFVTALLAVGPTGLVLALAAHAWPYYTAARLYLAARGRLPWRLQRFLDDAHRLGILRQVGPVHQFRHARLQERLARAVHVPGPRFPAPDPAPRPVTGSLR